MNIEDYQAAMVAHYLKAAEHTEQKALYETAAASLAFEQAQIALETTKQMQRRLQNASRPSLALGAIIEQDPAGQFHAHYGGLTASGDTPEIAFDNFDRLWQLGKV
jgi:hypothetical protein